MSSGFNSREWHRYLAGVPEEYRSLAAEYPPWSRWQLGDDVLTYYVSVGVRGDGRLLMVRHVATTGQPVQLHDGIDPKELMPWVGDQKPA
jgi:hypothetical protein